MKRIQIGKYDIAVDRMQIREWWQQIVTGVVRMQPYKGNIEPDCHYCGQCSQIKDTMEPDCHSYGQCSQTRDNMEPDCHTVDRMQPD